MRLTLWLAALTLFVPSTAEAVVFPRENDLPAISRSTVEFGLTTNSGYRVELEGAGRQIALSVSRGPFTAVYLTKRGKASVEGLRARFGHLGRISVRFRPSGKASREEPPRRCKGKPHETRFGSYVGAIRFRGEKGYVRVNADTAHGTSASSPKWRCKRRGAGKFSRDSEELSPVDELFAVDEIVGLQASSIDRRLGFYVSSFRPSKGHHSTLFIGGAVDRREGVFIYHYAVIEGGAGPSLSMTLSRVPK